MDATAYASKAENRKQIAEAIAPANYINAPVTVLEQVLTGTYADGLGNVKTDAKRVDFDPFPWQSFAVWMLTQMKRWGQIKGDVDYKAVAEQVYLATDTSEMMAEMGLTPPEPPYKSFVGDGQDLRSRQARRLSRELQDQEGVVSVTRTRPRVGTLRWDSRRARYGRRRHGASAEFLLPCRRSWHLAASPPARHCCGRDHDAGIRQADGR